MFITEQDFLSTHYQYILDDSIQIRDHSFPYVYVACIMCNFGFHSLNYSEVSTYSAVVIFKGNIRRKENYKCSVGMRELARNATLSNVKNYVIVK